MENLYNLEAEQGLLGCLLANNKVIDKVEFLEAEHFADGLHGDIFFACKSIIKTGGVANLVTLKRYMDKEKKFEQCNGAVYLSKLISSFVSILNAEAYGRLIFDLWKRRCLHDLFLEISLENSETTIPDGEFSQKLIKKIEAKLDYLNIGTNAEIFDIGHFSENCKTQFEKDYKDDGRSVIKTGFDKLDEMVCLKKKLLCVLGGRPSMGKTAVSLDIVRSQIKNYSVAYFQLEMTGEEMAFRLMSKDKNTPVQDFIFNRNPIATMDKIIDCDAVYKKTNNLSISDKPNISVPEISASIRSLKRKKKVDVVFIDHIGLLRPENSRENRTNQIGQITKDLKTMAKNLDVCVIALCQLSRDVEKREIKKPMLSDLRDSGTIEQDADIVMFVHREEYYIERMSIADESVSYSGKQLSEKLNELESLMRRWKDKGQIIVQKNRNGPVGDVVLGYDKKTASFINLN